MITPHVSAATATLIHPICLLDAPACDARPLAILVAGSYTLSGPPIKGFAPIALDDGARGYIPAAACAPHASEARGDPPTVGVVQDVALYRAPTPGEQFASRWLVPKDEPLRVLSHAGRFTHVERPNGQIGYVPATLCRPVPNHPGAPPMARLVQPVSLYGDPAPGSQLDSRWSVSPADTLLLLGRDGPFALVQRDGGQIGYVPSALLGRPTADALFPIGPVDLGWILLAWVWGLVNWGGVAALALEPIVPEGLQAYAGLAILLGVAALLWLGGRRRVPARSFALGTLLAYASLHLATGGYATLWR